MLAPAPRALRVHDHQRQPHAERRALSSPGARGVARCRRAARRCGARSRARARARRSSRVVPASAWRKRSKTCGRKSGRMPMPVSLTTISTCELTRSSRTCTRPPLRRELDGVRQQVPDDLLQAIGIARDRADARIERSSAARTPLASAAGCTVATALSTISGSSTGCTSSRILPETMRDTSSTSSTICVSARRVALERLEAALGLLAGQHAAAQQPRVADDGVQRRAQLVRQHREELVLHPVGVAAPRRTGARSRAPPTPTPAIPTASRSCCSVKTPTREWPKNSPPSTSPDTPLTGTAR